MNTAPAGGVGSSFRIVPVPDASPSVAPPSGAPRVTVKVSFGSNSISPLIWIVIVALVCPSAKLTVPVSPWPAARSSAPALPVRWMVQVAETAPSDPAVRLTVKVMVAAPESPSTTLASSIARVP